MLRAGKGKDGFSLLELLLVLVILGLGALVVVPAVDRQVRRQEVRQSALELAAAARGLRSRAITQGVPQHLVLNAVENSYRAFEQEIRLSPVMRIADLRGGGPLADGSQDFIFFPNGSTLGGEIDIASREGPPRYTIRLEPLSGRVVVIAG
jgi:general secretion pathway protein H